MINEVNYETVPQGTEEQTAAFKHAQNLGRLRDIAEMKRGYLGEIKVPAKVKAQRRAKNKAAKAARKRNRKAS